MTNLPKPKNDLEAQPSDELEVILAGVANHTAKVRGHDLPFPNSPLLDIHAAKERILAWHKAEIEKTNPLAVMVDKHTPADFALKLRTIMQFARGNVDPIDKYVQEVKRVVATSFTPTAEVEARELELAELMRVQVVQLLRTCTPARPEDLTQSQWYGLVEGLQVATAEFEKMDIAGALAKDQTALNKPNQEPES